MAPLKCFPIFVILPDFRPVSTLLVERPEPLGPLNWCPSDRGGLPSSSSRVAGLSLEDLVGLGSSRAGDGLRTFLGGRLGLRDDASGLLACDADDARDLDGAFPFTVEVEYSLSSSPKFWRSESTKSVHEFCR
jgi:hypothetical protein